MGLGRALWPSLQGADTVAGTMSLPALGTRRLGTLVLVLVEPGVVAATPSLEWTPGCICFVTSFPFHSRFDVGELGHQSEVMGLSFGCKEAGKAGVWLPYKEVVSASNQDLERGFPPKQKAVAGEGVAVQR